jgi:hypothetical protein
MFDHLMVIANTILSSSNPINPSPDNTTLTAVSYPTICGVILFRFSGLAPIHELYISIKGFALLARNFAPLREPDSLEVF